MTSSAWDLITTPKGTFSVPRRHRTCEVSGDSCLCPLGECRFLNPLPPHPVNAVEDLFKVGR